MKIAFFVDHFPSVTQTFILNQITGLLDRGYDVVIFTERMTNEGKVHDDIKSYNLLARTTKIGDLSGEMSQNKFFRMVKGVGYIFSFMLTRPFPVLKSINIFKYGKKAASFYLLHQIVSIIKRGRFDIIHCQFGTLGIKALFFRELGIFSGKLVVSFRGFDVTQYLKSRPRIYDDLFHQGDLFLPVSNVLKEKLIDNGCDQKKIFVHHSGIDCSKFQYKDRHLDNGESLKLLTVARLTEKKGIFFAVEAVARLIASGRRVTYDIVGEGELRDNLANLIHKLKAENYVQLVGWKNHEEVADYMQEAHVLIAPSIVAADGDEEGVPNVVKEAMAVGLPVVSTLHGGIPELVDDGVSGFLVHEKNIDELEDRLSFLIDHPEKWSEMGREGRQKVLESFDINKLNDCLVKRYQKLLGMEALE